jgi:sporulation protein YlmC with PRC-barrel domain
LVLAAAAWGIAVALSFSAPAALADEAGKAKGDKEKIGEYISRSAYDTQRFTRLKGSGVEDTQGQKLGVLDDLIVDRNGNIKYGIISHGGILGFGDTMTPVPWSSMMKKVAGETLVVNVTKKKLEQGLHFTTDTWPNFAESTLDKKIHSYYEEGAESEKYTGSESKGSEGAKGVSEGPYRMSSIVNKTAKDPQNQEVGRTSEVIIDREGKASYLILETDIAIKPEDPMIPIPWDRADVQRQGDAVLVNLTLDELKSAPSYPKDRWPDFDSSSWKQTLQQYYESAKTGMKETAKDIKRAFK